MAHSIRLRLEIGAWLKIQADGMFVIVAVYIQCSKLLEGL